MEGRVAQGRSFKQRSKGKDSRLSEARLNLWCRSLATRRVVKKGDTS